MTLNSSVACIGELLINFFCTDVDTDLVDGQHFDKQAGGAPANVCATISRLGYDCLQQSCRCVCLYESGCYFGNTDP
ncbi:hypothetical protein J7E79_17125 [Bacillus sp. ISL-40]|nr:hypothetical protein [Bacillus sp. ISL-40]MBT2743963.1 hypothetical protein [Bacillus sp. ISL-77]